MSTALIEDRTPTNRLFAAAESGRIPDPVLRAAIDLRVRGKVRHERRGGAEAIADRKRALLAERAAGPVTTHVDEANRQHYEVPPRFFELVLGPHLKYSSCYWPDGVDDLPSAEEASLEQVVGRACLEDGDRILELGAGWGSLSLYMAQRFPNSEIVTVSNSSTQRAHIEADAAERGLGNLTIVTSDIAEFEQPADSFDRVVSVEMFEHVRNHRELLRRVGTWLKPEGTCFIHVFSHRDAAWHFDDGNPDDWMAQQFFSGGTMPSHDLLLHEQRDLVVVDDWWMNGTHYARTLQAWLDLLDANRDACLAALASGSDPAAPELQLSRWRLFLLASIGTWGVAGGREFGVSHYRFENRRSHS